MAGPSQSVDNPLGIATGSNLPFSEWGSIIPDPRLVAAIVDRLTFHTQIIETGTESYGLRTTRAAKGRRSRSAWDWPRDDPGPMDGDHRRLQAIVDEGAIDELLGIVSVDVVTETWLRYSRDRKSHPDDPDDDPDWWAVELWLSAEWWADEQRVREDCCG